MKNFVIYKEKGKIVEDKEQAKIVKNKLIGGHQSPKNPQKIQ